MVGIYKITSPSGGVYIGQSKNISVRKNQHNSNKSKKGNTPISNSIRKYGFKNHLFEIIHELPKDVTQDVLNNYEILYIDLYKSCGVKMLNSRGGGYNGSPSDEHIKRMVSTRKHKNNYKLTESQRIERSNRLKGTYPKSIKPEHILKTAKKLLGRKLPNNVKDKISASLIGKKHSDKTIELLKESAIKRWQSDKVALSCSTGIFYDTLKELWAAEYGHYTYKCFWKYYYKRNYCYFV